MPARRLRPLATRLACGCVVTLTLLSEARAADAAPPAPRDHELFVGLNVLVDVDGQTGRVADVSGRNAVVRVEGDTQRIPVAALALRRFEHVTKISTERVRIENLTTERIANSPDPNMRDVVVDEATRQIQEKQQERLEKQEAAFYQSVYNPAENQAEIDMENERREMVKRALEEAPKADEDLFTRNKMIDIEAWEARQNGGDTLNISFTIAADQPQRDAYTIIFVSVTTPAERDLARSRVIMRRLPPLGTRPAKVHITENGMPQNFRLEACNVHVYAADRELGSNVAQGAIDLTRTDAIQFLRLRYLADHADATLPAQPIWDFLTPDVARMFATAAASRTVLVQTDAAGEVTDAQVQPARSGRGDAALVAALRRIPFYPALDAGKPVAGRTELPLARFAR